MGQEKAKPILLVNEINEVLHNLCEGVCQWVLVVAARPGNYRVFQYIANDEGYYELKRAMKNLLLALDKFEKGEVKPKNLQ